MTDQFKLRAMLLAQGHTLSSWARANGYRPGTVQRVIWRAFHEPNSQRRGVLTHRILADIQRDAGLRIVSDIPPSKRAA
jgi:hypothetical protein